jgi:hypothetical protein
MKQRWVNVDGGRTRGLQAPTRRSSFDGRLLRGSGLFKVSPLLLHELVGRLVPDGEDSLAVRGIEELRMKTSPVLPTRLPDLHLHRVGAGPTIASGSGDLPAHLRAWGAAGDLEAIIGDLASNVNVRRWLSDRCELISEVFIESGKPGRQPDDGAATPIERHGQRSRDHLTTAYRGESEASNAVTERWRIVR